jgi:glycosyltransferase involved in cell wall biosynthesis
MLKEAKADVYLGHYIDTLLPVWRVSRQRGAIAMFDSMEFHSGMGESQRPIERQLIRAIEKRCLPDCSLVLASSEEMAELLAEEYGINRPLPLYNVPPVESELAPKLGNNLHLYWRNSIIGLGERGLDEALVALTKLPADVVLHLQGRRQMDGGRGVSARIRELGVEDRVMFHPPYLPHEAVKEAAPYDIGLCLERGGVRNHEVTVSSKMFDYHMAGLAIIASDLPGLHTIITRSGGGILFQPGSAEDLAEKILIFYKDRQMLKRLATNARAFALREANQKLEEQKFVTAFRDACAQHLGVKM